MTTLPFTSIELDKLKDTLGKRESGGRLDITNSLGYVGKYQFGAQALESVGYLKPGASKKGNKVLNDPTAWNIPGGLESFKKDSSLQDEALNRLMAQNYKVLKSKGVISDKTSKSDIAGYLLAAHLGGAGNAIKLAKGQDFKDAYGSSIKEYYNLGKSTLDTQEQKDPTPNTKAIPESKGELISVDPQDHYDAFNDVAIDRSRDVHPDQGFIESFTAGFERENPILNAKELLDKHAATSGKFDPEYNPLDDIKGYEPYAKEFIHLPNKEAVERYKQHLDKVIKRNKEVSNGGVAAFLGAISGGLLSPTTLIPGIGLLSKGGSITRTALLTGGTAALAAGLDEIPLLANDETRSIYESLANVSAAAALGGILGGVVATKKMPGMSKEAVDKVKEYFTKEKALRVDSPDSTAGAKMVDEVTLAGEGIVNSNPLHAGVLKSVKEFSPATRLLTSSSKMARKLTNQLIIHDHILGKNLKGKATDMPVEAYVEAGIGKIYSVYDSIDKLYAGAKKKISTLKMDIFENDLFKNLRYGDKVDADIAKASKEVDSYFKRLYNRMVEHRLVDGNELPWSKAKKYLINQIDYEEAVLKQGQLRKLVSNVVKRELKDLDEVTHLEVTDTLMEQLMKTKRSGFIQYKAQYKNAEGKTENFILDISGKEFDEFKLKDVKQLVYRTTKGVELDVAYKRAFGDTSLAKQIKKVEEEYNSLIEKNPERSKELLKEKTQVLVDLKALDQRLKGTYALPDNPYSFGASARRAILAANYLTKMGAAQISQLPDLGRLLMHSKVGRLIGDWLGTIGYKLEHAKLTKEELKKINIGAESYINIRAFEQGGLEGALEGTGSFKKIRAATDAFTRITGLSHMNDFTKRLAGEMAVDDALTDFGRWVKGELPESTQRYYLKRGIGLDDAKYYLEQYKKHRYKKDGAYMANLDAWENADKFNAFIKRSVDTTIVTPTAGDKPLWMSKEWGQVIGQFKSFPMAAVQKVLLPGLQEPDAKLLSSLTTQITLGAVAYITKEMIAERKPDLSPDNLIKEGIDRSGVLGILYDGGNVLHKLAGIGEKGSRDIPYAMIQALGPSAGLVQSLGRLGASIHKKLIEGKELNPYEIHALRQLVPAQNLLWLTWLFNRAEEEIIGSRGYRKIKRRRKK